MLTLLAIEIEDTGDDTLWDTALVSHKDSSSMRVGFKSLSGLSSIISSGVEYGNDTREGLDAGGRGTLTSAHGPSKHEHELPICLITCRYKTRERATSSVS